MISKFSKVTQIRMADNPVAHNFIRGNHLERARLFQKNIHGTWRKRVGLRVLYGRGMNDGCLDLFLSFAGKYYLKKGNGTFANGQNKLAR